jgi:hypothetical protein
MNIIINIDNDAFASEDNSACAPEIARILEGIVKQLREEGTTPNKLYDLKGNQVGAITCKMSGDKGFLSFKERHG